MSPAKQRPSKDSAPKGPGATPAKAQGGGNQADRLAAALRDNLKRRKAQARARGEPDPDGRKG